MNESNSLSTKLISNFEFGVIDNYPLLLLIVDCEDIESNELGSISVKNISRSINTYEVKNEVNQTIDVRVKKTDFPL